MFNNHKGYTHTCGVKGGELGILFIPVQKDAKQNSHEKLWSEEGRKEMFNLTTHSTHFIYGYMASDIMVKDHSDSERGNPLPHFGLFFPISSKDSFICTIQQTG